MNSDVSKLETIRQNGKTQVDAQRASILDAAETLFLQNGLENTSMTAIAAQAGITRMSLYRYFPDRHSLAFEIAARMLKKIAGCAELGGPRITLESLREIALAFIDQFYPLRSAYRYLGMFDHLYGDRYPNETLAAWYKEQVFSLLWGGSSFEVTGAEINRSQLVALMNSIFSFLEKMAARGDLLAVEQEAPLDEQLGYFRNMISLYFDHLSGGLA